MARYNSQAGRGGTRPMERTLTYTVVIEQDEDGVYIADVPALPGCHSFGTTPGEAERNIEEAIQCYLGSLVKAGEQIPKDDAMPFSMRKTLRVSVPAA